MPPALDGVTHAPRQQVLRTNELYATTDPENSETEVSPPFPSLVFSADDLFCAFRREPAVKKTSSGQCVTRRRRGAVKTGQQVANRAVVILESSNI